MEAAVITKAINIGERRHNVAHKLPKGIKIIVFVRVLDDDAIVAIATIQIEVKEVLVVVQGQNIAHNPASFGKLLLAPDEIGRASCRERV